MSMIVCDQNCRHQQEGYCGLNHITQLTSDITAKCGYYEPLAAKSAGKAKSAAPGLFSDNPERLG